MKKPNALMMLGLVFVFLIGCNEKTRQTNDPDISVIKIDPLSEPLRESDIYTFKKIIPLETTEESLIGSYSEIKITDDAIYVLDADRTQSLFKFNLDGKFQFKVGSIGKGPGEFVKPAWFDVSETHIYLHDAAQRQMNVYKKEDGAFEENFPVDFGTLSFSVIPNSDFLLFYRSFKPASPKYSEDGKDFTYFITDSKGEVVSKEFPYKSGFDTRSIIGARTTFFKNDGALSFFTQYNDTIYQVNSEAVVMSKYALDYGNNNQELSTKYFEEATGSPFVNFDENKKLRNESGVYELFSLLETEEHILVYGVINDETYGFIYNQNSKYTVNLTDLEKDYLSTKYNIFNLADSKYLYKIHSADYFLEHWEGDSIPDPRLLELTEDDNVVLIQFEPKDF